MKMDFEREMMREEKVGGKNNGGGGGKNRKGRCNERREMKSWRNVGRRKVDGIRRLSKE